MGTLVNPSILAAMAGITNGDFANQCLSEGGAGRVTIGGYSIGKEMIMASNQILQRGREEFTLQVGKESSQILREANKISNFSQLIINLRLNNSENAGKFVRDFHDLSSRKENPILEINAHCQQPEVTQKGGGQGLLQRFDVLTDVIRVFQSKDFEVSLKIRGNAIDPDLFIPRVKQWQLDFLHIDSYKIGKKGTDLALLKHYKNNVNTPLIGNNSIVDKKSAQAVLNTGVQFFSVARAANNNPLLFHSLVKHF
ncbi:MAG: tRNA-dihydrouridine synthase [Promethearchaeota archaeon]